MAENFKHLYEQMKKLLTMYQDELVPGFRKQIEELEAKSKWIPVTERLPEERTFVLVFAFDRTVGEALYDGHGQFYWANTDEYAEPLLVTHWMPLPEPPKED